MLRKFSSAALSIAHCSGIFAAFASPACTYAPAAISAAIGPYTVLPYSSNSLPAEARTPSMLRALAASRSVS